MILTTIKEAIKRDITKMKPTELAAKYGVYLSIIYQIRREMGIYGRSPKNRKPKDLRYKKEKELMAKAMDLYLNGETVENIATTIDRSKSSIELAITRELKRRETLRKRVAQILEEVKAGKSLRQIGKEISLSGERVRQLLEQSGFVREKRQVDRQAILDQFAETPQTTAIAERLNWGQKTINKVLDEHFGPEKAKELKKSHRNRTSEQKTQIMVAQFTEGQTVKALCQAHDIAPTTVRRRILPYIKQEEKTRLYNEVDALRKIPEEGRAPATKVAELFRENKSPKEIASILDCTRPLVDARIRALRLQGKLPPPRKRTPNDENVQKRIQDLQKQLLKALEKAERIPN